MQHKASQGQYTGGRVPFGHRLASDGEHLEPDPAEQAILAEARGLRSAGLSLERVAERLGAVPTETVIPVDSGRKTVVWKHPLPA